MDNYDDSIFALNYIYFCLIYLPMIHAELSILFHLPLTLNLILLHLHIFYVLRETYSSIWVISRITTSTTLVNTDNKWIIKSIIRVKTLIRLGLGWQGWLFKDTHYIMPGISPLEISAISLMVANDPLKLNSIKNILLINLNIYIMSCFFIKYLWISKISLIPLVL